MYIVYMYAYVFSCFFLFLSPIQFYEKKMFIVVFVMAVHYNTT